jgi:hypothetical protein
MIPAKFGWICGIPAEIRGKDRRKIAGIPVISMVRTSTVKFGLIF